MSEQHILEKLVRIGGDVYGALDGIEDLAVTYPEDEELQDLYVELRNCLKPAYYRIVHEGSRRTHKAWTA